MPSASYNPAILGEFAQRLINRANTIVALYTFFGVVLGGVTFFVLNTVMVMAQPAPLLIAVIAFAMCVVTGVERSFTLRVQAQTVLCQVAIEANTRQLSITTQLGQVGATELRRDPNV